MVADSIVNSNSTWGNSMLKKGGDYVNCLQSLTASEKFCLNKHILKSCSSFTVKKKKKKADGSFY